MSGTIRPTVREILAGYRDARLRFFRYRSDADVVTMTGFAIGFAAVTGAAAQIRIPLPFTPVPITLQTFTVLLAGIVLGMRFGGLSQAMYVLGGTAGMPWFQGWGAGLGHLLGPTGGYLVGFVGAAAFIGYVVDRSRVARRLPVLVGLLLVANFVIIYGFGLAWLFVWMTLSTGTPPSVIELLAVGAFPFIPGDLAKLVAAAIIGGAITPREDFRRD